MSDQGAAVRRALHWMCERRVRSDHRGRRAVAFVMRLAGPAFFGCSTELEVGAQFEIPVRTLRRLTAELKDFCGLERGGGLFPVAPADPSQPAIDEFDARRNGQDDGTFSG